MMTIDIVEEATPDTVKTDMERIKPMGSINVLLFQAQLEPVESERTGSQNDVPHVSIKHEPSSEMSIKLEPSTEMALKAVILDGRSLSHSTRYAFSHTFVDRAHMSNSFKPVKNSPPTDETPNGRGQGMKTKRGQAVAGFHFHYLGRGTFLQNKRQGPSLT